MKGSGFGNAIGFAIKYTMASGRCHMYMASKDKDEATLNIEEKIFNRDLELMQAWFIDTYDKQYKKQLQTLSLMQSSIFKLKDIEAPSYGQLKEKSKKLIVEQGKARDQEVQLLYDQIDECRSR